MFCGASSGNGEQYLQAARALGEELVRRDIGLVYGGGNVGLMGAVAETVGRGLGEQRVIGVIPDALAPREVGGGRSARGARAVLLSTACAARNVEGSTSLCRSRSRRRPLPLSPRMPPRWQADQRHHR